MASSTGFYELPRVPDAQAAFESLGLGVRVMCVSNESGLNFDPRATGKEAAARQRAYRALAVELNCVQPIGGQPRLIAPRPVAAPENLTDEQLVQPAVEIGYLDDDSNHNPACLGMTILGKNIVGVGCCQAIDDMPGTWWAYVTKVRGRPFVLTGVLLCVWHQLPRDLVGRQVALIRQEVVRAGGKFSMDNLWVWVSPGGRNKGLVSAKDKGFSISADELTILDVAGEEFRQYASLGTGRSEDKPHGLDVVGLAIDQIQRAGVSNEHIGGLFEDTVTTRTAAGSHKWGSRQGMGPDFVSSIIAGAVYDLAV